MWAGKWMYAFHLQKLCLAAMSGDRDRRRDAHPSASWSVLPGDIKSRPFGSSRVRILLYP
jgi:hypothetical protein